MRTDDLSTGFLERYLPARLGCGAVAVTGIVKFPRGSSRETWFVDCDLRRGAARETQQLVFRRDFPGGSVCPMPLRTEFDIYDRLKGSAVPVAEVLWYEDDPGLLEGQRPFYVRRHIEGDWQIPHFQDPDPRYDRLRIELGREHVRKLALIHTCDWQALGFGELFQVPASTRVCHEAIIESVERELAAFQIEPFPLFLEAKEWLLDNPPAPASRISLLKGTNGYGEEIFADGRIVAMSDWELARLGDPAYDWAQLQDFAADVVIDGELVWGLQPALDYYEEISGIRVDPASVQYYRMLYSLIMMMFCHNAAIPVVRGTDLMARLCWPSTEVLYRAQCMMAAMVGVGQPPARVPGQLGG
ncbi:MAG: phosphotransferase [Alphaproteobacteria bacterium]|nr:phosphotransferase [Alphaproteobacteria bacterium]